MPRYAGASEKLAEEWLVRAGAHNLIETITELPAAAGRITWRLINGERRKVSPHDVGL